MLIKEIKIARVLRNACTGLSLLYLVACSSGIQIVDVPGAVIKPDTFNSLIQCDAEERHERFSVTPQGFPGANIAIVLDEKMDTEKWGKITRELSGFIDYLGTVPDNRYKVTLIYDERNIFRMYGYNNRDGHLNPFSQYIADRKVSHIRDYAGIRWADAAFFYSFAQADNFKMSLENLAPSDAINSSQVVTTAFFSFVEPDNYYERMVWRGENANTVQSFENCSGDGMYYRPRAYLPNVIYRIWNSQTRTYDPVPGGSHHIPSCLFAGNGRQNKIEESFQKHTPVNLAVFSTEDLDLNFDLAGYDPNDPFKRAFPEPTIKMFSEITKPLGKGGNVKYHAFVSMRDSIGTDCQSGSGPCIYWKARLGTRHLSLAQKTGGSITSIDSNAVQSSLRRIADNVVFDPEDLSLACAPREAKQIKVIVDGRVIEDSDYEIDRVNKEIRLLPTVFMRKHLGRSVVADILY